MKPITVLKIQLFSACVLTSAVASALFCSLWEVTAYLSVDVRKYIPFAEYSTGLKILAMFFIFLILSYDMLRLRLVRKGAEHWWKLKGLLACCKESYFVFEERPVIALGLGGIIAIFWLVALAGFAFMLLSIFFVTIAFGISDLLDFLRNVCLMIGGYIAIAAIMPSALFFGIPFGQLAMTIWLISLRAPKPNLQE